MIYLFDDKVNRQLDYGWTRERLDRFSNIIKPIHQYNQIEDESTRKKIFSPGNIILFHESFFDNTENKHGNANNIRSKLNEAQENKNFRVIYFSGSKVSRKFDDNIGHIPVSLMYQNLDVFLKNVECGEQDLRYLFFGKNYRLEELLENELAVANKNIEDSIQNQSPNCKNFIALTLKNEIETVFENATYETFFLDKENNFDITDEYLSNKIKDWFFIQEYDNIFIPLCFGPILSDYNGLSFALHIRCTDTPNQFKNIFLYSFVDFGQIVESKYFDVLKIKNINLIPYSKLAFEKSSQSQFTPLKPEDLRREIKKVKLDPPNNYEDSHSIANEWAIYRWASAISANDNEIEKITNKVQHQLYFKYLKTIYPVSDITPISESDLKIKYAGNPKILYIDDEADKGWFEILCTILDDYNGLGFHYLDEELKALSREEIIEKSLNTIETQNIDLVILDFRLHPDDFNTPKLDEVTGLKLLTKIKDLNPGIQVIIFSATNKIWNLKALQEAGADGFVVKESLDNNENSEFTNGVINELIRLLSKRIELTFLKQFYKNYYELEKKLIPRKNYEKASNPLDKDFVDEVLKWLRLSIDILNDGHINDSKRTSSFLFLFSVLENLSNHIINIDKPIPAGERKGKKVFKYEFRGKNKMLSHFIEDTENEGFYRKANLDLKCGRNIPWHLKILNTIDSVSNKKLSEEMLSKIVKKRNDFIHSNTTTGNKFQISNEDIIFIHQVIYKGLKNI